MQTIRKPLLIATTAGLVAALLAAVVSDLLTRPTERLLLAQEPLVACPFRTVEGEQPLHTLPPSQAPNEKSVIMTVETSLGTIEIEIDRSKTPCTALFLNFLAEQGFYDGSACHRLTTWGIYVLQCGDPTGTGRGGPGFKYDEENLPGLPTATSSLPASPCVVSTTIIVDGDGWPPDGWETWPFPFGSAPATGPNGEVVATVPSRLPPASLPPGFWDELQRRAWEASGKCGFFDTPTAPPVMDQENMLYQRGVVAMASLGQFGTTGSQFFFVYRDMELTANYTPFGTVISGQEIIDQITAGGVIGDSGDGEPRIKLEIKSVQFE